MADGKNIEIKIAATGGDQAAAEFKKASDGAKELVNNPNNSTGFGGMLEQGEKVREAREKANAERLAQIEAEKAAIDELAKAEKKALDDEIEGMRQKEKAAVANAERLNEEAADRKAVARKKEIALAVGAISTAAALAAKALSNVYSELEAVDAVELKKVDAAFAEQIENAKKFKEALADPIGALAALANGGTTVKEAFTGLSDQLKLNADAQSSAVDRLLTKSDAQVKEIKRLAEDIAAANALLEAQTAAARAVREGENAAAIRNGADPDDTAAAEAKRREAEDIASVEAEQNAARSQLQQKYDASQDAQRKADQAKAAAEKINSAAANADSTEAAYKNRKPGLSVDETWALKNAAMTAKSDFDYTKRTYDPQAQAAPALQKKADEERKAFEDEQKKVRQVDELAAARKVEIRAKANTAVDAAGARKSDRLESEKSRREDAGFEARESFQDYQKWRAEQAAAGQRKDIARREVGLDDSSRENAVKFGNAGKNVGGALGKSLQGIGEKLSDGTNEAEVRKLAEQFKAATQGLGGATIEAMQAMLAEMQKQAADVAGIKRKLKLQ